MHTADLHAPRVRDPPLTLCRLTWVNRLPTPRLGNHLGFRVTWHANPNHAATHTLGNFSPPCKSASGSYPPNGPAEPNPRGTNKCSGPIGLTPSPTACSDQRGLERVIPLAQCPAHQNPYIFSFQSDASVGTARPGGGRGCLHKSWAMLLTFFLCFQPCEGPPSYKIDGRRTGTQASCASVTAISTLP